MNNISKSKLAYDFMGKPLSNEHILIPVKIDLFTQQHYTLAQECSSDIIVKLNNMGQLTKPSTFHLTSEHKKLKAENVFIVISTK